MKLTKVALTGLLASGILLGAVVPAHADVTYPQSATTKGSVKFKDGDGKPDVVNPVDPDGPPVTPVPPVGTEGLLRLDQVPTLDFGTVEIKGSEVKSAAKYVRLNEKGTETLAFYTPAYVQLTDQRGNNAGWTVTTKMSAFTAMEADVPVAGVDTLEGATVTFKNGELTNHSGVKGTELTAILPTAYSDVVLSAENTATDKKLMGAEVGKGTGTWVNNFYDTKGGTVTAPPSSQDAEATDATIELAIPGTAKKSKDYTYVSTITWTVSSTPDSI